MLEEQPAPPAERPASSGLRFTAGATLAGLALIIILIALAIALPLLGAPSSSIVGIMYIPPQAYLIAVLAPMTTLLGFITGFAGIGQSWRARRYGWLVGFVALLALLMVGPALLIYEFGVDWDMFTGLPWLPSPQTLSGGSVGVLVFVSFVALLLTGVFGLVAVKSARPAG